MALIVKDYSWKQTGDHVVVTVPLQGTPSRAVDVVTDKSYIKVNFKPFLFEAFLSHPIQESSSRCTISGDEVEFHLQKEEKNVNWTSLCALLSREEKKKARQEALNRVLIRLQEGSAAKRELHQTLQRKSVQQQIQLETSEKNRVKQIQNLEKAKVMEELQNWKSDKISFLETSTNCSSQEDTTVNDSTENDTTENESFSSDEDTVVESEANDGINLTEDDLRPVPLPRSCGSIIVKFTPRAFPTPTRESQFDEEQAWLKKQAAALRSVGFVAEDLRPEECDPMWLKDKGDSFFRVGNYLGAISAYTHGIKLSKDMASLYVNRSAAHYAVGNFQRVLEDCSKALELMTPKVDLNADSRAKCHVRRGTALCKLGILRPGLADLEAALALRPNDDHLKSDIDIVKAHLLKQTELDV